MKKINVTLISPSKIVSAYKSNSEYQAWIDTCIAQGVWGAVGNYSIEVLDATAELEAKRQALESTPKSTFDSHANSTNNPHSVTKSQVGLENVDNTSDANKPISIATQGALDLKYDASNPFNYVDADGAGLAAPVQSVAGKLGVVLLDKSDVGLSNVPNTDATLRSNHTGTQLSSTISDFDEAAQDAVGNALVDSADINFTYPDAQNQITAELSTTGVVSGTYTQVSVDSKGRVTSASNNSGTVTRYGYFSTTTSANSNATYTTVSDLTSGSLPIGLYRVSVIARAQSGAIQNGIGLRISNGTATLSTVHVKWFISQGASGTAQIFSYDQIATTTNLVSASAAVANATFAVIGEGLIRITSPGTVAVQLRSEVSGTASSLLPDSIFILELV